jgi:hypothetical protein
MMTMSNSIGEAPVTSPAHATGVGGHLHGAWGADVALVSSDRRLKTNIVPLYQSLAGWGVTKAGNRPKFKR